MNAHVPAEFALDILGRSKAMTSVRSFATTLSINADGVSLCARSRYRLGISAILVTAGICAAGAQQREAALASAPIVEFHISAQPLASALQAYGERTGVQVLYESNSASGRKSVPVDGKFTREDALNMLLTGTDLKVQYIRPDVITLALRSIPADRPPSSPLATPDLSLGTLQVRATNEGDDAGTLRDFNESLQVDIQKALQNNVGTRGGSYRLVVDLWIASSHTIQRTQLLRSTGDQDRDAAVAGALRGLVISRSAPATVSQPVRVAIRVKSIK